MPIHIVPTITVCLISLVTKEKSLGVLLDAIIAAIIAFVGAAVYIGEAVMRNRKSRII